MGTITVRWKKIGKNLRILFHPICNRLFIYLRTAKKIVYFVKRKCRETWKYTYISKIEYVYVAKQNMCVSSREQVERYVHIRVYPK